MFYQEASGYNVKQAMIPRNYLVRHYLFVIMWTIDEKAVLHSVLIE